MRQQQEHDAKDQKDLGASNNMSRNEEGIRREDSDGSMAMEDSTAERSNPKKSSRNNKKRQLSSSGTTTDDTAAMSHSSDSTFGGNDHTVEHTAAMAKREERAPSHSTVATMDTSKSSQLSTSARLMQQRARNSLTKQDSQSHANNTARSSTTSTIDDTADEGGESAVGEKDQNNRTNKPQQEQKRQLSPRRGLKGKQPLALSEKQRMLQAEKEQQQQPSSLSSLPNLPCHSPPAPLSEKQRTFLAEQEQQQQQASSLSSLPVTLPSSADTTSAAELEKIMEAQSFLDSFGTRHSFTKNAQPNLTSERRRRKRNSSYARRTQSLGENMLPRKSVLQEVLQEAQEEAERERDRAIREILGECSSSSEEEEEEKREEEYDTQQPQEPPNSYSAYNSYAARVARKQRDMAVASTASSSTPGSFAYNSEPSSKQTDVDEEIAKARQQQTSQSNPKSSAAAPLSRSLTPPPTAPLSRHQSSKHSVGTDASAVSSLDDNSLYSNAATTLPSTSGLSSAPTTLTPFQQRMQQQLSNPRNLSSSTTNAQPGAFPTQGRAPFSNPYLRGGGPGDLLRDESEFGADPSQLGNSSRYQTNHRRRRDVADDGHVSDLGEAAAEETEEEIVAVCVEEDDLENNIRDEIIRSAAQADVVNLDEELSSKDQMVQQLKFLTYCLLAVVLAAVALVIVARMFVKNEEDDVALEDDLALNVSEVPSMSPTFNPIPTLQKVSEQGLLRCGIYETTGFDKESGERFGVDADWCRAIAAAVHGKDSYAVKLVNVTFADRFELIANRDIDVLAASSTFTMARNAYEVGVETGLTFSPPFMYDGMRFAGVPEFVECADNDMKNFFECRDIKVCVVGGTSYQVILASRLPKRQIVLVDGWQTLYGGLRDGQCNVIAAEGISLGERNVRAFGYRGNYTVGKSLFSKIPLSIVTRNDDPQWSDFVAAVMQSTFVAEQEGITRENSHLVRNMFMSGSMLFGEAYEDMFENVIATIGNFAELYERHAESAVPRQGSLTLVNNGTSGLLFAHPFGFINNEGPGPTPGGTLERIMERGKLRCAIKPGRPGFAESIAGQGRSENATYTGFDIDFCRALATSIFSGSVDLVQFMEVASEEGGFEALADDKVDVLAGGSWTLQNDVRQPTTGQGFSFSQPYFYGADFVADIVGSKRGLEDNLCMVTREDDPQWSTYVYWLVASTFYAEERGISQRQSNRMPEVHIFGRSFLRMLRDPILEFGNVGELYERNLQALIPRGVRNMINSIRNPGPQIYPMPGMLT